MITLLTTFPFDLLEEYINGDRSFDSSGDSGPTDHSGRCRWSTNSGEPFLFIKYEERMLNIADTEKQVLILKDPFELERGDRGIISNYLLHFIISFMLFCFGTLIIRLG